MKAALQTLKEKDEIAAQTNQRNLKQLKQLGSQLGDPKRNQGALKSRIASLRLQKEGTAKDMREQIEMLQLL